MRLIIVGLYLLLFFLIIDKVTNRIKDCLKMIIDTTELYLDNLAGDKNLEFVFDEIVKNNTSRVFFSFKEIKLENFYSKEACEVFKKYM